MFAMPGKFFVDESGNSINQPAELTDGVTQGVSDAGLKADGYLRSWHLTPILREIIRKFRDE